jgi:hypothetical protein
MLHKLRIALAVTILALAATAAVDSASAANFGLGRDPIQFYDGGFFYGDGLEQTPSGP